MCEVSMHMYVLTLVIFFLAIRSHLYSIIRPAERTLRAEEGFFHSYSTFSDDTSLSNYNSEAFPSPFKEENPVNILCSLA